MLADMMPRFEREKFTVMLKVGLATPSSFAIAALVELCLTQAHHAEDIWHCVRDFLSALPSLESEECHAAWCLVDALMKRAPLVFLRLIAPRLEEYVTRLMPWHKVQREESAADVHWWEALIASWEGVVPMNVYQSIRRHWMLCRAGVNFDSAATVKRLFGLSTADDDDGDAARKAAASREQINQLKDVADQLVALTRKLATASICNAGEESQLPSSSSVSDTPKGEQTAPSEPPQAAEDDEDDYTPQFAFGGSTREKPAEAFTKREQRKRTRRDDDE